MATLSNKGIFILPKPSPGTPTLQASIILTAADSTTILDSAKRLALNGSPASAITPSPLKPSGGATPNSQARCKRKLNFAKLGLHPDKHRSSPKTVEKRNARERNRVKTINGTFEHLRDHLPCGDSVMQRKKQKKMSKVDILKGAIDYISMLKDMLDDDTDSVTSSNPCSPCAMSPGSTYMPSSPASYPSPTPSNPYQQQQDVQKGYGSFLAALTSPGLPPPPPSPAESLPSSVCSSADSVASPQPPIPSHHSQHWAPDDEELMNFATWFQ